eukprot:g17968.t1
MAEISVAAVASPSSQPAPAAASASGGDGQWRTTSASYKGLESELVNKVLLSIPDEEPVKDYTVPGTRAEKDFWPKNFHPRRCFSQEDTKGYRCKDSNFPSAWAEYQPRQEDEVLLWYKKTDVLRVRIPAHVFHLPNRVADDEKPTMNERLKNEKKIEDLKRVLYSMNRAHQSELSPKRTGAGIKTGAATPMQRTSESFYKPGQSAEAGGVSYLPRVMYERGISISNEQAATNASLATTIKDAPPADDLSRSLSPGRDQAAFMELETVAERVEQEKVPEHPDVSGPQYARNCIAMGIHYDNIKQFRQAIPHYEKFLKLCMRARDKHGMALAYHCMALDYQLLALEQEEELSPHVAPTASPSSSSSSLDVVKAKGDSAAGKRNAAAQTATTSRREKDFEAAIQNHVQHRNHADLVGRFVAHVNLGICFGHLGDREASTMNHQVAFQLAHYLRSKDAKRLSARNIAFDAQLLPGPANEGTMQARFQLLAHVPGPEKSKPKQVFKHGGVIPQNHRSLRASQALKQIGDLHKETKNFPEAVTFYDKALTLASRSGEQQKKMGTMAVQLALAKSKCRAGEQGFVRDCLVDAGRRLQQKLEYDRAESVKMIMYKPGLAKVEQKSMTSSATCFNGVDPTDLGGLILTLNTNAKKATGYKK